MKQACIVYTVTREQFISDEEWYTMNENKPHSFSSFDIAKNESDDDAPERFYHGFVLGLMVELAGRFEITFNRESGFGRYDIMLIPKNRERGNLISERKTSIIKSYFCKKCPVMDNPK